jgi:hypothetical protein
VLLKYLIKHIAVIVVAEREVSIDASFPKWSNQFGEMPVVTRLAILQGQITIDKHAHWLGRPIHNFSDNLAQMSGDRRIFWVLFTNVSVVQQINQIGVDFAGRRPPDVVPTQQNTCSRSPKKAPSIQGRQMDWQIINLVLRNIASRIE